MDFSAWLDGGQIDAAARAQDAWARIQRNPLTVTVVRGNTALAAQTVRLVLDKTASEPSADGGVSGSVRGGVLFGVVDHPTEADADLQRGDIFALHGTKYRVLHVGRYPGEVQARVEAYQ